MRLQTIQITLALDSTHKMFKVSLCFKSVIPEKLLLKNNFTLVKSSVKEVDFCLNPDLRFIVLDKKKLLSLLVQVPALVMIIRRL